ncbi:DapH/DapD/GlmU-related protein [Turicibacter sp. TS3]|uniref:acyltransferase n=1 Tax=Turicibacter sp. TS3 TaxID=2304578 RepID=UPI00137AADC7|nr:acyltransferase [Turicibacter sp. TS3]NCE77809.1 acyltransferase [Turicibacter sp. TS3]
MLIEKFIKKIKGNNFELDSNIPTSYLINKSIGMGFNLVRGNIKFPFIKKNSRLIFVGKKTKIKASSKVKVDRGVNIGDYVVIDALSFNGVSIGSNVRIGDYSRILCSGTIRNLGKGFTIGDNCGIGENCFFGAAGGIEIGNDVIMGQNVRFHSENHNYLDTTIPIRLQGVTNKGIQIGNDCWIGAGAVFLDGVKVGNGCVIGANTLVNKDIPDNHVAVGIPMRIVKKRV